MQKIHIRYLFFTLCILMPLVNYAQQDTTRIPIPMKNGKIYYEQTFASSKGKSELFELAGKWFASTFPDEPQALYKADKATGQITGTGMFKVITSNTGNYYWLKFDVAITVTDAGCFVTIGNYYEKPIEKGISNQYSKISYRWWDYRQGHPWSAEDKTLFNGLNQNTLQVISSFKQSINQ
ncbi:DUF4468 domain-containing protein [Mucilaginibacter sp. FT3.2]|uniref:DUF4468 domain-containing protein n=1 Tax=Mucilaginibacter sp. FT3.2 TaxID=2723090 RepID=UPI00160E1854|nr:DUF4468 domain-containing protein [Mucilaginibacter sp. FT3.2]MBB6230315.1 hypothetical protein [Mucilaginibacter sp. FT3.2]